MRSIVIFISLIALIAASDLHSLNKLIKPPRGVRLQPHDGRIVGGEEAVKNTIPYQVGLFIYADDARYFCGGSLISTKCVLTAAHCIKGKVIEVILGAHNIDQIETTQKRVNTTNFIVHEGYDSDMNINDLALILFDEEVELNKNIDVIKLPSISDSNDNFVDKTAMVSGWGKTSDQETAHTDKLQYVEAPIMTNKDCDSMFFGGIIIDSHICMEGDSYKSACSGDSGGPLVYEGKLIGCVSFGIAFGCEAGFPSAFTRITSFLPWISEHSGIILEE